MKYAMELREDIEVAIQEFLERQPGASQHDIQKAIRLARKGRTGRRFRRLLLVALTLIVTLSLGVLLLRNDRGSTSGCAEWVGCSSPPGSGTQSQTLEETTV